MTHNTSIKSSNRPDGFSLRTMLCRQRIRQRAWRIKQVRGIAVPDLCPAETTCVNCGLVFVGNYCPRCGQYRNVPRFSIRGFMSNVLKTIFRVDGKFGRTIMELIYRPGHMIRDFIRGRRVNYTPPFALLFLSIMFYMLLSTIVEPLLESGDASVVMPMAVDIDVKADDDKNLFDVVFKTLDSINQHLSSVPFLANIWTKFGEWAAGSHAFQTLLMLPFLAICTRMALVTCRAKYDYNFMEHIFVQAFISSQQCIINILLVPLALLLGLEKPLDMPFWLTIVLYWWVYRQLFLCTWKRAAWVTLLMLSYFMLIISAVVLALVLCHYAFMV